jgi:hypothetical protein
VNWFPHYRVNQVIHGAELDSAAKATSQKEIFLFAKKQVLARPDLADAVELAIRDSWLTLLTNKELRTKVHTEFAEDDIYQKTFLRLTGLYNRLV